MATPKKTASGRWQIQVYVGKDSTGKRIYKAFTADTKKEAERLASEYLQQPRDQMITLNNMTVGDAVDAYIKRREHDLSPKTLREYKAYRHTAFPKLMDVKLLNVTDDMLQLEIDREAAKNSAKTVCLKWGLVGAAIRRSRKGYIPDVELPTIRHKKMTMPESEDLLKLFVSIEGEPIEIPVLLATACGLRRSEIAALDLKTDVDYVNNFICVSKAMVADENGEWIIKPPKSDAGYRTVPCPEWIIQKLKTARDDPSYRMYKPHSITNAFKVWAKKYDIPCTFHGLRHYFASAMLALNVPDKYAMELMGHSTNYMLKRYQEILAEKEVEINRDVQNYFNNMAPDAKENANSQIVHDEYAKKHTIP